MSAEGLLDDPCIFAGSGKGPETETSWPHGMQTPSEKCRIVGTCVETLRRSRLEESVEKGGESRQGLQT